MMTDIFETQKASELQELKADLEDVYRRSSHDLQAPIRKLKMFIDILESELGATDLSPVAKRSLEAIGRATQSMEDIVLGLLSFTRIKRHELQIESASLDSIVDEALKDLSEEVENSNAVVERSALPRVDSDTQLLQSLYVQLLANALQYHEEGQKPYIKISVDTIDKNAHRVFTIEDQGIGIPPDQRTAVLEPFVRLHSAAEYRGSGMGLAICDRIIKRLGGQLWVEESPKGGTKVCFTLKD